MYRLIDPRSGTTFYVGRGRGNRVFSHAAGEEKPSKSEDAESLKISMIREIRNDGFQVQHVIHRHGMNEDSAKEVEAALIDAYPGLLIFNQGTKAIGVRCMPRWSSAFMKPKMQSFCTTSY